MKEEPEHVKEWKEALESPRYKHREDGTLTDACDRLTEQWLLFTRWRISALGPTWEGHLDDINTARPDRPKFSMSFEKEGMMLTIAAFFDQFICLGQERETKLSFLLFLFF